MELGVMGPGKTKATDTITVNDAVFAQALNEPLIHQVVVAYQAAGRAGTKAQKSRSEVRGGGKKPWRQKGTGRARAGTIRSPIWVGGGITFAAKPRQFKQKVNKKMYRCAVRSLLSELIRQGRLCVIEEMTLKAPKTKECIELLKQYEVEHGLIITESLNVNLHLASRNIPHVLTIDVAAMNPVLLVKYEKVLVTKAALKKIEEQLS